MIGAAAWRRAALAARVRATIGRMTGEVRRWTHPKPLLNTLRRPGVPPGSEGGVELIETHISWVLLAGEHAWKLKKPLDLGFLDFPRRRAGARPARRSCGSTAARCRRSTRRWWR